MNRDLAINIVRAYRNTYIFLCLAFILHLISTLASNKSTANYYKVELS